MQKKYEMIEMDLSPRTDWLESVLNKHLTVEACFAEFFDNSFDHSASVIEVTVGPDTITILDNGDGIANMEHMLAFSDMPAANRPRIGRYGVGAKYGAYNLGSQLTVETRHGLMRQTAFVDWQAIRESRSWKILGEAPHPSHGESFTKLIISRINRGKLSARLEGALVKLTRTYRPALIDGKRIMIDGEDLEAPPLPQFKNKPRVIEGDLEGRHFRLTFGIRADDSPYKGYDVAYMYRVIIQNDTSGFGQYSPLRVYGYLELLNDAKDWTLQELKSGGFGERDDLYALLLPQIEDILIEAQRHEESIALENATTTLNERLRPLSTLGRVPAKRDPEYRRGPYEKHDPPEHNPRRPKSRTLDERLTNTGYKVIWDEEEPGKVGEVTYSGNTGIIHLNPTYTLINDTAIKDNTNAYLAVCCMLIVMDWHERQETERPAMADLFVHDLDVIEQVSKLLKIVEEPRENEITVNQYRQNQ